MYISTLMWTLVVLAEHSLVGATVVVPSADATSVIASSTAIPRYQYKQIQRDKQPSLSEIHRTHNDGRVTEENTTEIPKTSQPTSGVTRREKKLDLRTPNTENGVAHSADNEKMFSEHEDLANKMDDIVFDLGVSQIERLFQGLMGHSPLDHISLESREELPTEYKTDGSPIFATILEGIKETLSVVAIDTNSRTSIPKDEVEHLFVAALGFASLLENAVSESSLQAIASRAESSENLVQDLLPLEAISNIVREIGTLATDTAKVVAQVVDDIEKIAEDAHDRKEERLDLAVHATEHDSKLTARFLPIPGLDPLTVAIHVMTAVFAEVGYNYYKSRGKKETNFAQAEFKAQTERLAYVEQALKNEIQKNKALQQGKPKHNH